MCAAVCSACGKTDGGGGGGGGGGGPTLPDEIGAWMPKGAVDAWQGAWSSRLSIKTSMSMSMAGDPAALEITGDKAKVFDGTKETEVGFIVDSPCSASFKVAITEGTMKGGTSTITKQFMLKDGKLLAGEGATGMRKGKAAIVCMIGLDKLVTLDDKGVCKSWSNMFDKWSSKDATCTWSKDGDKDILTIGKGDWTTKVYAEGDLLQNEQFADYVKQGLHTKAASYDAAKTDITAKLKDKK